MYSITVINSTGEYTLHNSYDEALKLISPVLKLELNKSGTLTFSIDPDHPNRAQILPMASEIYVYDDNQVYWIGRPLTIEGDWDNIASVTCEGILGYLLDTQIPPFDFTEGNSIRGTDCVRTFLSRLITRHFNSVGTSWAGQRKYFYTGTVTVTDSNNNLARSSEDYHSTLETINEKLLEPYGGYIRLRWNSSTGLTRYIDYIETFGAATQQIVFGENLLDLNTHTDAGEIYTAVIPEGAQIGDTDKRVTLEGYTPTTAVSNQIKDLAHGGAVTSMPASGSMNGFRYVYDAAGINRHGRIFVKQTWDDVTTQQNLALKAAKFIGEISVLGTTIELSAVDLSRISVDYKRFNLGEIVQVISLPHDIQAEYQITQMTIDLYDPSKSTLVLGGKLGTYTFDNTKQTTSIENAITDILPAAIQNATALLSGGLGGYLIIRQDDNGQPYEILIMNAATESAATRCVRINKNGIGFGQSKTGSTDWTYRNAWTIDGNLIADFITTGTLNASLLKTGTINANLIKAGTINANLIKAGTLQDANGNTSLNMTTGVLSMKKGSINLGKGKFTVNDAGTLNATTGKIGGWSLSNSGLVGDDGTYYVYFDPDDGLRFYEKSKRSVRTAITKNSIWVAGEDNDVPIIYADRSNAHMKGRAAVPTNAGYISCSPYGIELKTGSRSTTAHSGNLYTDGINLYHGKEASSSRKIKHDIKPVENDELDPERLYDAEVVQFKYNDDYLTEDDPNRGKDLIGFIIEDLDEIYPSAIAKDKPEDPETWTWSPIRMIPAMLKLIQDQKKQIDSLEDRLAQIEATVEKLKGENNG